MIRRHHEVVPERFPEPRPPQHRVFGRAGPEIDEVDPDFHRKAFSPVDILRGPRDMSLPSTASAPLAGFSDVVLLIIRIIMGVTMIYYGWPKVRDPKKNAKDFEQMSTARNYTPMPSSKYLCLASFDDHSFSALLVSICALPEDTKRSLNYARVIWFRIF